MPAKAVFHQQDRAAEFGNENLLLYADPFNKEYEGHCYTEGKKEDQFKIPRDENGNSVLTGEGATTNERFTCAECEVYLVC